MSDYKGNTNKINKVKLDPSIDRVVWTAGWSTPGAKAGLAVDTHFIGNNSELKIQLKDASGKDHGSISGKIYGNQFWKEIEIPEKAKDSLTAKVKFSKHNIEMESNALMLFPRVEIKNLKWDKNEARRGDILKLTADVTGVYEGSDAEVQIWEHDADLAHDLITKIPTVVKKGKIELEWEFEYHEDTDDIVTSEESEKGYNPPEYFFKVVIGGVEADSELLKFKDWIEIEAVDRNGNPLKNQNYTLTFSDGAVKKGKLDENGYAKVEDIPPGQYYVEFPDLENK